MRYTQPQGGPLQIDWANPLTKGIVFCVPGVAGNYDDIAGKRKATVTGALGRQNNANGSFPLFAGSQWIDYPAFGPELPTAGPATIAFIDQAIAPSGYSSTVDFIPFGATQEVLIYQSLSDSGYNFSAGPRGTNTPKFTAAGQTVAGVNRRIVVRTSALNSSLSAAWDLFLGQVKIPSDALSNLSANFTTPHRWGARDGGLDPWEGALGQMVIWNRALTDTEAKAYNANPWQIFKSPQRVMLATVAGGAATYSYTGAGGFVFSGAATRMRGVIKAGAGGLQLSGAAPQARGVSKAAAGGLLFAGSAPQVRGRAIATSGGLSLSGAAGLVRGAARAAAGGIQFAGAAAATFFSAVQSRVINPVGGMLLRGSATIVRGVRRVASGGIKFGGHAVRGGIIAAFLSGVLPIFARRRRRK